MFEVTVSGWFAAAHQLRLSTGVLEALHGHNWTVRVTFAGPELDSIGVLIDFTQLKPQLDALLAELHDRNLNELAAFRHRNPSAENVAVHVAERMAATALGAPACVEVEETPGCVARYRPNS
jgi:6-pyruvoyltetrahydropterin/6-carboxytetrahydropterin synthase